MRSLLAAIGAAAVAAACGDLAHRHEETQKVIDKRVVGMPAGDFFTTFGNWKARSELADGGAAYLWESEVGKAPPGVYGLDERICKLRVTADKNGRIATVEIRFDNPGRISTSRCSEIFRAG